MKLNFFLIAVSIFLFSMPGQAQYDSLMHDGLDRTFLLHLPPAYNENSNLPLVIAMHGGFGSAQNLQNQSLLSIKADQENFIVVYPEGIKGGLLNIRTWNAGWCCGFAASSNIDDVGFISTLIDILSANYSIDTTRVYATGMSNGGYMSYRLACEIPERFAAIAPVAASMTMESCTAAEPVPVIHFHSFLDENVKYYGGSGSGVSNHYSPPLDSILNVWGDINQCTVKQDTITSNSEYTHVNWTDGACESTIDYYITEDGGHSWPGGTKTVVGDEVSTYINANDLMWEFFQKYTSDCTTTPLIEIDNIKSSLIKELYPNPSSGNITVQLNEHIVDYELIVYNPYNQVIFQKKNSSEISLEGLVPGIYILTVRTEYESDLRKIVLNY